MAITKKTSLFSDVRFPSFIRSDPNFDSLRRFVKSYFESLEQEGAASYEIDNAMSNNDVDSASQRFLQRFYSILYPDLPSNISADKRLILKHTNDLYHNKGTPESFRLLFRMMFDEEINIKYPRDNILRASDGNWKQSVAMQIRIPGISLADALSLGGSNISCVNSTGGVYNNILTIKKLPENETYEVTVDRQKNIRFFVGDNLLIGANNIKGTVLPSPTKISVTRPGKNFRLGQIIKLDIGSGSGTLAKITNVDSYGGIKGIKFIKFGSGYTSNFTLTISPSSTGVVTTTVPPNINGNYLPIMEFISGFSEQGVITKTGKNGPAYDYFAEDYVETDYSAAVVGYFGGDSVFDPEYPDPDTYAFITVSVGAIITYPGFWSDNRGRLNDPLMVLQDNDLYQTYSYIIQSNIPQSQYDKTVKSLVHPAGMRMFSDLLIEANIDLSSSVVDNRGLHYKGYARDLVDLKDVATKIIKLPVDDVLPGLGDVVSKQVVAPKSDSFIIDDLEKGDYFAEDFAEIVDLYAADQNGVRKFVNAVKLDAVTATDVARMDSSKGVLDSVAMSDLLVNEVIKATTDSVTLVEETPYAADYFAEDFNIADYGITINKTT